MTTSRRKSLTRKDDRIIIHFDYDCFYASVFEAENPALRTVPLAVKQKQIIVTCNYEARRRGLHKLQLITEAKKICPDVVIVLGEQLDRFRDASNMLYKYLEAFTWNKKVEKLGFDEVFMDVTDIVTYNQTLLNSNDLSHTFFQLSQDDPTVGFLFDATTIAGHEYPERELGPGMKAPGDIDTLLTRLRLGSHLAQHLRHRLEEEKCYTSTVGISTSKLLAKLAGNLHKPKGQTTLMPPYEIDLQDTSYMSPVESNVTAFIDSHEIGKIPGIGFKMSHKIRSHILSRPAKFDMGLIYGGTMEAVTVRQVRLLHEMSAEFLEKILGGQGAERDIGIKTWALINGIDDSEVKQSRKVPSQISIEDSYLRLDNVAQVRKELRMLATGLVKRMHVDLLEDDEDQAKRWIAHPKTIRLSTRPRLPLNADGTRNRSFSRISRSCPLPNFIFNLREGVDALAEKLIQEVLIPMFHRLHPEHHGWNLSLVNVGVTNMVETASDEASGGGRDIARMFKRQESVLKGWKVEDKDVPPDDGNWQDRGLDRLSIELHDRLLAEPSAGDEAVPESFSRGSEDALHSTQATTNEDVRWYEDEDENVDCEICSACGAEMPPFAMAAHERYHLLGDEK